jgi:hypothetical protein
LWRATSSCSMARHNEARSAKASLLFMMSS